jgi:opacity protein-like surface antigen
MLKKYLLILGLTLLLAVPLSAQEMSFGPQLGYYKAQDADEGSFMGGVAWRFKLMPALGIEASINYRQEKYADGALTVKSWPIMVTGLIYPLPFVYGAVGAGWYSVTLDYNRNKLPLFRDKTTEKFGWHFGGGVELPVAEQFNLTADVRYVFLNYDFEDFPGSNNIESNFYVLAFGFLYIIN